MRKIEEERQEALEVLKEQLTQETISIEEKNNIYSELKYLNEVQGKEENLEKKIKKEFDLDCFIKIDNKNMSIDNFQILIPIAPNDTFGFRLKNREKYQNNATAIAWANVFYAIFSGCEFTLSIISEDNTSKQFTYSFKKSKIRNEQKQAKQILQYYKYIHEIELLQGVNFKEYENLATKINDLFYFQCSEAQNGVFDLSHQVFQ